MGEGEDELGGATRADEDDSAFPLDDLFGPGPTDDLLSAHAPTLDTGAHPTLTSALTSTLAPGHRLGHYALLEELGRGGMGVVYAATDTKLGRKVAIKLILAQGHPALQRRLVREAMAMAKLSHPNVIPVYEIGEHGDSTFIVMEYVEGLTLRAWLDAPRGLAEILAMFASAAEGLAAAHAKDLVHRDFKPDNVMIGEDGRVRVMDFGLARAAEVEHEVDPEAPQGLDPEPSVMETTGEGATGMEATLAHFDGLTHTGALLGTPAYMSPEQLRGEAADARSDQFAFCVALYEATHGVRPFVAQTFDELREVVTAGALPDFEEDTIPAWLDALLRRGLARPPQERFASMGALLDALERGRRETAPVGGGGRPLGLGDALLERRLIPLFGSYVLASILALEIVVRVGLAPVASDVAMISAALLAPAALLLIWTHGKRGRAPFTRAQVLATLIALGAAGVASTLLIRGARTRGLDALAQTLARAADRTTTALATTATDASPADALTALPEPVVRQACVMMMPLGGPLTEDEQFLRTGPLTILESTLERTALPLLVPAWSVDIERLRKVGAHTGAALPESLMFELAGLETCAQVLHGDIERLDGGPGYRLTLRLSAKGAPTQEVQLEGASLFDAIDGASAWLVETLDAPDTPGEGPSASPPVVTRVRDRYTADEAALQLYLRALDPFTDSDAQRDYDRLAQALERDPTFVRAGWDAAGHSRSVNGNAATLELLTRALEHDYRLDEAEKLDARAFALKLEGKPELAENAYLDALHHAPDDVDILMSLAALRNGRGDSDGTLEALERVILLVPDKLDALEGAWSLYFSRKRFREALAIATTLVELQPDRPRYHLYLGNSHLGMQNFDGARAEVERAYALDPGDPIYASGLAEFEMVRGDHHHGLELFAATLEQARKRAEDSATARDTYNRLAARYADYLRLFGRSREAYQAVQPVVEWLVHDSGKPTPELLSELIIYLAPYGLSKHSAAGYRVLDGLDPGEAEPNQVNWLTCRLTIALTADDDAEVARTHARLEALLEREPILRDVLDRGLNLRWLSYSERWEEAAALWREDEELHENLAASAFVLEALAELERFDEVEAFVDERLAVAPNQPDMHVYRARVHWSRAEAEAARTSLDQALRLWAQADADYAPYAKALRLREGYADPAPAP